MVNGLSQRQEINKFASFLLRYQPGIASVLPLISPFARDIQAKNSYARCSRHELYMAFNTDPFLSARLLSEANSVIYNHNHLAVYTLREAFEIVDVEHAFKILHNALRIGFSSAENERNLYELWKRWITVAYAAQVLSHFTSVITLHPDALFVVGLIHDIGHLLELNYDPDRLTTISRKNIKRETDSDTELHTTLGASLARTWALPAYMVNAIRWHHSPQECPASAGRALAALIFLADKLADCCLSKRPLDVEICKSALAIAGITEKHLYHVKDFFSKAPYLQTFDATSKRFVDTLEFFKLIKSISSQRPIQA